MSARLLISEAEILPPSDFDLMTLFPREQTDNLIADAIAYPAHWAGFTVGAAANAQVVSVSPGRYFNGRTVFEQAASLQVNLQAYCPTVVSDERWVALILRGTTETEDQIRPFKDLAEDADTGAVVMRSTPKVERRRLGIVVQQGLAAPAPALKPVVAETDCCIAMVRLKSSGVQEIVAGETWRVKPLFEVEGRVTAIEVNLASLFNRTLALETDFANLNAKVNALPVPRPEIIRQLRRDVAALRIKGDVPEGARSDFYDPGLLPTAWDFAHPSANFRVNEGVQFPYTKVQEARLEVANEDDPRIRFRGRRMMPAWSEVKRLANEGGGGTRDISSVVHSVVTAIQNSVSRSAVSYGATINVCENAAEWNAAGNAGVGQTFGHGGETFEVVGKTETVWGEGHDHVAVRQVSSYSWTEYYWSYINETFGFNGSVYGQTFLVAQPLIATSLELYFTKIGVEDGIKVAICETDATGAPLVTKILAFVEVTKEQLAAGGTGWKKFDLPMTALTPGARYAWFTVTTGNHQLQGTTGNAFTGGTSFRLTDGIWAQGDQDFDFAFRLNGARFANARTVIDFRPMTLEGGMTEFRLLYANWVPSGTALEWEIRPFYGNGVDSPWSKLEPKDPNPLTNLPALVELRCTMLATQDLAPMIEMDAKATYRSARVGNILQAVTKLIDLGLTCTTFQTLIYLDDFDPDIHTFNPRIMIGDSPALVAPQATTISRVDERPEHVAVLSTFVSGTPFSRVRLAPGGNSQSITDIFFLQNVAGFAI